MCLTLLVAQNAEKNKHEAKGMYVITSQTTLIYTISTGFQTESSSHDQIVESLRKGLIINKEADRVKENQGRVVPQSS